MIITITILIRIVNFFRDSLQGLVDKWGGIDEEGMAEQTLSQMKNSTKKVAGFANKSRKFIGNTMMGASNFIDRNGVTKTLLQYVESKEEDITNIVSSTTNSITKGQ